MTSPAQPYPVGTVLEIPTYAHRPDGPRERIKITKLDDRCGFVGLRITAWGCRWIKSRQKFSSVSYLQGWTPGTETVIEEGAQ